MYEFDSYIRGTSYKISPNNLYVRTQGTKGICLPWGKLLQWIDELWDMYDSRKTIKSSIFGEQYYLYEYGLCLPSKFSVQWKKLMKFTDELWEVWDYYQTYYTRRAVC